jgi:hypothetical protein
MVLCRNAPDARSGKSQQIQINKLWHWFLSNHRPELLVHQRRAQLWQKRHQTDNVIMKTKLAILIFGALVLMANDANARHGNYSHGYARGETPQYQSSGDVYESFSEGHQPYANPDRELYVKPDVLQLEIAAQADHELRPRPPPTVLRRRADVPVVDQPSDGRLPHQAVTITTRPSA